MTGVVYVSVDDWITIAALVLGTTDATVRSIADLDLADSREQVSAGEQDRAVWIAALIARGTDGLLRAARALCRQADSSSLAAV